MAFSTGTLSKRLNEDFKFTKKDNTLSIIDNYHLIGLGPKSDEFYKKEFLATENLKVIDIYFDLHYEERELNENYEYLAHYRYYEDPRDLVELMTVLYFARIKFGSEKPAKERLKILDIKNSGGYKRLIKFVRELDQVNVEVRFRPYNSLQMKPKFEPPFHGRYWFGGSAGYIVDGSLNTFETGMVFAQKMDDTNYEFIHNIFVNRIVKNNNNVILTLRDIERLTDEIIDIFINYRY